MAPVRIESNWETYGAKIHFIQKSDALYEDLNKCPS